MFINDSILSELVTGTSDQFYDAAWSYYCYRKVIVSNSVISYYDTLKMYCGC